MILAGGLTPAWQQVLQFDRLVTGQVNRARSVFWCASGKVLNVGAALHHLGAGPVTVSPAGGATGQQVRDDFSTRGIAAQWIPVASPTRVCTTLLDGETGVTTELVENSAPLTSTELHDYVAVFAAAVTSADLVVLSGSLPTGTPSRFYRELLDRAERPSVLDIRGRELLECLPCRPRVVKPNREELSATVGRPLESESDLLRAMEEVRECGAEWVIVSDGGGMLRAIGPSGLNRFTPPSVTVVNPIGCGDSLTAAIAAQLAGGRQPLDAIEFAVQYAARKAATLYPVLRD